MPSFIWFILIIIAMLFWLEPEKTSRDVNEWWTSIENGWNHPEQ